MSVFSLVVVCVAGAGMLLAAAVQGWRSFARFRNLYVLPQGAEYDVVDEQSNVLEHAVPGSEYRVGHDNLVEFADYGSGLLAVILMPLVFVAFTYNGQTEWWEALATNVRGGIYLGATILVLVLVKVAQRLGANLHWRRIERMGPRERQAALKASLIIHGSTGVAVLAAPSAETSEDASSAGSGSAASPSAFDKAVPPEREERWTPAECLEMIRESEREIVKGRELVVRLEALGQNQSVAREQAKIQEMLDLVSELCGRIMLIDEAFGTKFQELAETSSV